MHHQNLGCWVFILIVLAALEPNSVHILCVSDSHESSIHLGSILSVSIIYIEIEQIQGHQNDDGTSSMPSLGNLNPASKFYPFFHVQMLACTTQLYN